MMTDQQTNSIQLENDFIRVKVNNRGAELSSFYSKSTGIEHLWQADPAFWAAHAPNLFPVVGQSYNNQIRVDGVSYELGRHGFARHSEFKLVDSTPEHAKFSLRYTDETLKVFPYKFDFQVLYDLSGYELRISYKVINLDDKTIYFSVGAHPAFNIPFTSSGNYDDYYIEFEHPETLNRHLLNETGYFDGRIEPVPLDGSILPLTKELFKKDALVFKELKSRKVEIKNHHSENSIKIKFPHFTSLGIWAKYGAPFVCIEPWHGYADSEGFSGDISEKENILHVEHGHVFETEYFIAI